MKKLLLIIGIVALVYWFKKSKTEVAQAATDEPGLKSAWLLSSSADSPLANSTPTADGSGSGTSTTGTTSTSTGTRPNSTITSGTSGTSTGTTSGGSGARRLTTISAFTWNKKSKSAFR